MVGPFDDLGHSTPSAQTCLDRIRMSSRRRSVVELPDSGGSWPAIAAGQPDILSVGDDWRMGEARRKIGQPRPGVRCGVKGLAAFGARPSGDGSTENAELVAGGSMARNGAIVVVTETVTRFTFAVKRVSRLPSVTQTAKKRSTATVRERWPLRVRVFRGSEYGGSPTSMNHARSYPWGRCLRSRVAQPQAANQRPSGEPGIPAGPPPGFEVTR